jgi:hypothetical protein
MRYVDLKGKDILVRDKKQAIIEEYFPDPKERAEVETALARNELLDKLEAGD